jgi:hypothetical protein
MAKKVATKPSGNVAVMKGPKAPFVKPQKASASRKKPEG